MLTGLTSVTFRKLSVQEVVQLAVAGELQAIEWGGDIHCPPGNLHNTEKVLSITKSSGLVVSSYGSYYRLGKKDNEHTFDSVLETAAVLQAPVVRIWAGVKPSADTSASERAGMVQEALVLAEKAKKKGIVVAFEYHRNSLTDSADSALKLMQEIDHSHCRLYWQANYEISFEENIAEIETVGKYVVCAHVFGWDKGYIPLKLEERKIEWSRFFNTLPNREYMPFLLEFVKEDNPDVFLKDCETLKEVLGCV